MQNTAYDMRISDWSSDVCSSDLFRTCFPGAPQGQPISQCRATAYADLQIIRRLRNRIAHHEPIFSRNIADDYQRIHDMIAWRSQVAAAWMDRKQAVLTLQIGRDPGREKGWSEVTCWGGTE